MSANAIRVVIADDHPVFREGFHFMIHKQKDAGIEIVADASNGKELVELVEQHRPDVVVTDIKMPEMDGVEAARIIKQKFPSVAIIALSMFDEDSLVLEMLDAGARGYLSKNAHKEELVEAISAVNSGGSYFSNSTSKKLVSLIASSRHNPYHKGGYVKLTDQELKIVRLICQQLTTKQIAHEVDLSPRTVEDYRQKIQEKIGARCAVGIALYAVKNKIVGLNEL